jgi:hypothetical protein
MLALLVARAAGAQTDPTVVMHEHYEKGQLAYEAQKYELAAAEFRAAYQAKPSASLLYNEAVCVERMKRYDQALKLYREYLDKGPSAKDRADAERRIAAIEAHRDEAPPPLGFVEIESVPSGAAIYLGDRMGPPVGTTPWNGHLTGPQKIILVLRGHEDVERADTFDPKRVYLQFFHMTPDQKTAWVDLTASVAGASVYLDDVKNGPIGQAPFHGNVSKGHRRFIVRADGFEEQSRELDLAGGGLYTIELALPKAPIGFIEVGGGTSLGAVVKVDGQVMCQPAPCRGRVPSGAHELRVEKPGLKPFVRRLGVDPATETEVTVRLQPDPGHGDVVWKAVFAGVFVAGGVVLALESHSVYADLQHDIDTGAPPPRPGDDRYLRGKIFAYAADGCFVLGAATAVVATVSLLTEHGPPSEGVANQRDLAVAPVIGAGYAGVNAAVRW